MNRRERVREDGTTTRAPDAPLEQEEADAYRQVQPPGFKDNPRSAIEAADIDVEDTIGGE